MKNQRLAIQLLVFVLVALVGVGLGIFSRHRVAPSASKPVAAAAPSEPNQPSDIDLMPDSTPRAALDKLLARLRHGPIGPGDLDAFRAALLAADPAQAIAAIRGFLATGQDALTGEHFTIGPDGTLSGAPTLRVLLLDMLGQIGQRHSLPDGGEVARAILDKKTSADEWAVALRNAAWTTPEDRAYLAAKARELISYQPWRQQHSPGYYEAFDVIVYTHDVTFIADLGEMVRGTDEPIKNTAASTLDRLAAMAPLDVMSYLNTNPSELADKPYLRSDYYTKADFTQPAQRAAVEIYLDRPDIPARAKEKIIAALGAPNTFVSENLLTTSTPPPDENAPLVPPAQKTALDRAFSDWLKSNRYPSLNLAIMNRQLDLKQ